MVDILSIILLEETQFSGNSSDFIFDMQCLRSISYFWANSQKAVEYWDFEIDKR